VNNEDWARVNALVESGRPLDPASARALVAEVYRLKAALNGTPTGVSPSQAWFWTPKWQQMEREADDDIAAGRVKTFDDMESFLADLEAE